MAANIPLAERMRPQNLENYIGQTHLVGQGGVIRNMIETGRINSVILWGPPGVGKTTLARIIANASEAEFYTLSAVTSGVKDVREVIDRCEKAGRSMFAKARPILFMTRTTALTSRSRIRFSARWNAGCLPLSEPLRRIPPSR